MITYKAEKKCNMPFNCLKSISKSSNHVQSKKLQSFLQPEKTKHTKQRKKCLGFEYSSLLTLFFHIIHWDLLINLVNKFSEMNTSNFAKMYSWLSPQNIFSFFTLIFLILIHLTIAKSCLVLTAQVSISELKVIYCLFIGTLSFEVFNLVFYLNIYFA